MVGFARAFAEDIAANNNMNTPAGPDPALEPLACKTCRARKLRCDRAPGACGRCERLGAQCLYPESRRKCTTKRRNVKDLEERLAQVESLLNKANRGPKKPDSPVDEPRAPSPFAALVSDANDVEEVGDRADDFEHPMNDYGPVWEASDQYATSQLSEWTMPYRGPPTKTRPPRSIMPSNPGTDLLGLGMSEFLPPAEMIDELHNIYFTKQHPLVPIIHPARYLRAYHSSGHLRPPMALCYAIWANAANGHPRYKRYHDALYRRSRSYLQEDELKDEGEHFVSLGHAQAWALLGTDEARCMWFTRASMSSARCVKLVNMLGLHRLDEAPGASESLPTLLPPKDWTELEERRRVFWGVFCLDSHGSFSTGWPLQISVEDVSTHLPSSEASFLASREESTSTLEEAMSGAPYSSFATSIITCHIFNQILKQVHRKRPNDCPEDVEHGKFWRNHRDLDNMLSSAFMFLPERCRLPKQYRDPVAVQTNLNLHAGIVCLHNKACEVATEFNLAREVREASRTRLLAAAQEIVDIMRMTSKLPAGYRSPLSALSLYAASSAYVSSLQEDGMEPTKIANLEYLVEEMTVISRQHQITMSFRNQTIADIDEAGLRPYMRTIPSLGKHKSPAWSMCTPSCGYNIPLFTRSRASKHSVILPPLPGRLPLGKPMGHRLSERGYQNVRDNTASRFGIGVMLDTAKGERTEAGSNKRKRTNASNDPSTVGDLLQDALESWTPKGGFTGRLSDSVADPLVDIDNSEFPGGCGNTVADMTAIGTSFGPVVNGMDPTQRTASATRQRDVSAQSTSNGSSPTSGNNKTPESSNNTEDATGSSAATPSSSSMAYDQARKPLDVNPHSDLADVDLFINSTSGDMLPADATVNAFVDQFMGAPASGFYAQAADNIEGNYLDLGVDSDLWRVWGST